MESSLKGSSGFGRTNKCVKCIRSDPIFLFACIGLYIIGALIIIFTTTEAPPYVAPNPFSLDDITDLKRRSFAVQWLESGNEFVYVEPSETEHALKLFNAAQNTTTTLAKGSEIKAAFGLQDDVQFEKLQLTLDQQLMLFATNVEDLYRHSSSAEYHLYDLKNKAVVNLGVAEHETWQLVTFSEQVGNEYRLSYVTKNDVYVKILTRAGATFTVKTIRITNTAELMSNQANASPVDANILNGVADWGHEEEIMGNDRYVFWSPDGKYLSYATFDQTKVPIVSIPHYDQIDTTKYPTPDVSMSMANEEKENPFDQHWKFRYPGPGQFVSDVSLTIVNLTTDTPTDAFTYSLPAHGMVYLGKCLWADSTFVFTVYNQFQNERLFESVDTTVAPFQKKTLATHTAVDKTFITPDTSPIYVSKDRKIVDLWDSWNEDKYCSVGMMSLDAVNSSFTIINADQFQFDVKEIAGFDAATNVLYVIAAAPDPNQRGLYKLDLNNAKAGSIVPVLVEGEYAKEAGSHSTAFSPDGKFFVDSFSSITTPGLTSVVSAESGKVVCVLEDNKAYSEEIKKRAMPTVELTKVQLSGIEYRIRMTYPPQFNKKKKHPVLLFVYGGPDHNQVQNSYGEDQWHVHLSSAHDFIIARIDGHGSGCQGIKYRTSIFKRVGEPMQEDYYQFAKYLSKQEFVDPDRVMIYGWSFGGYMTMRSLSYQKMKQKDNEPMPFSYGIAVAPVSDWRLYDKPYTERFMQFEKDNQTSYVESSMLSNERLTALGTGSPWLLAYGSTDDNVHPINSLQVIRGLLDRKLTNYDVMVYPNDQHGIRLPGSRQSMYIKFTQEIGKHLGFGAKSVHQISLEKSKKRAEL
ncbi:dipeptidyl peptidase IV (CD26) [Blattamonas nauphoetae]|uniref:Dipeptidyl peptidase IV (CD26) n=1 Tax=Blattamonas nauphoetae TaxID=2049346 RepID=A0ABQ9XX10_9EUKA|nr:dipeptidyl peptidase IV (CD26) [Blattamonas nauphoetae]